MSKLDFISFLGCEILFISNKSYFYFILILNYDVYANVQDEGNMRYAISRDVTTYSGTFIQFELSMGCENTEQCYGKFNILLSNPISCYNSYSIQL